MTTSDSTQHFETIRKELYSSVIGDILDTLNCFQQFFPKPVKPLLRDMKVVGRAMPVLLADVCGHQQKPFGLLTEALDQLEGGEVYVGSLPSEACACWGEILTATAKKRGAVGAVVNAPHRDTLTTLEQDWPVFSTGAFAQDSAPRMKVVDFRCTIGIGALVIQPGDLIFGDEDGVVVIPRQFEEEVLEKALEKARGEKLVRKAIEGGLTSTEAFKQFGIL